MILKADALIAVIEEVNFGFWIKIPPETLSRFTLDNKIKKKIIKSEFIFLCLFLPSKSFWAILEGKMRQMKMNKIFHIFYIIQSG